MAEQLSQPELTPAITHIDSGPFKAAEKSFAVSLKRPLSLAMAVVALAGSALAASVPAEAASYRTGGAIGSLHQAKVATLGAPTSNEYTGHGDRVQTFRNGLVIWSAKTGAHSVTGGILGEYKTQGSDGGSLGLPVTEEIKLRGGVYQQFKGGVIYWAPGAGAHSVHGAFRSLYAQLGAENGALGYPTSGETVVKTNIYTGGGPSPSIVTQTFQHGMLTWNGTRSTLNTDPAHAHVIVGDIYKEYVATGGAVVHGNAVNDASRTSGAFGQNFLDGGQIVSDPKLGAHLVSGTMYDTWMKNGGATGRLGLPKTDAYQVVGWPWAQDFQGGRIDLPPVCTHPGNCVVVEFGANLPPELPNPLQPAPTPTPSTEAPAPVATDPASPAPTATASPAPTDTATSAPTDTSSTAPTDTASPAPTSTLAP